MKQPSNYPPAIIALLFCGLLLTQAAAAQQAGPLHIDPEGITVSGISAGGAMANQLHVAYADVFSGAGIIAGVPFGCAEGSLATAMARCMGSTDGSLVPAELAADIKAAHGQGQVADPSLLEDDVIWLFHGSRDTVVAAGVSDAVAALYLELVPAQQVTYVKDIEAGHNFPTREHGSDCAASASPYVGHCDYDAAGDILRYLYPGLEAPDQELQTGLSTRTIDGAAAAGLSETAYVFVPPACSTGEKNCALHLVLHGCAQSAAQVQTAFIEQSGYLPWAAANDIVLAFPQVAPGAANPYACWDWWGYSGVNYRWRSGVQMKTLVDWLGDLNTH